MVEEKKEVSSHTSGYVVIIVVMLIMMMVLIMMRPAPTVEYVQTLAIDRLVYFNVTKENLLWRIECNNLTQDGDHVEDARMENISFFFTEPARTEINKIFTRLDNTNVEYIDRLRFSGLVFPKDTEEIMSPFLNGDNLMRDCYVKARTEIRYKIYDEGRTEDGKVMCYIDDEGPFDCYLDEDKWVTLGEKEVRCQGTVPTEESLRTKFYSCLRSMEGG